MADEAWWEDRVRMAAEGLGDLPASEAVDLIHGRLAALLSPPVDTWAVPVESSVTSLHDPWTNTLYVSVSVRLPPEPGEIEVRFH